MHIDRKILRACAIAIAVAFCLRLAANTSLLTAVRAVELADVASAALFLQTGRLVRSPEAPQTQPAPEVTEPVTVKEEEPEPVYFLPEDASLVEVNDFAGSDPDVESLLLQPLQWDLTGQAPKVLILHTHGSESYENTEGYEESSQYRTLDERYNVVSVGERIGQLLTEQGLCVLHDKTLHDYPSYNGSYANSREAVKEYLQENPTIELVLDVHRDAMVDSMGNQVGYTVSTPEGEAARVMLVVGQNNETYQTNLALAEKLQVQLEKLCPGICRPICLRSSRFNQDLSQGALLIEIGAAGNTRQEALLAADYVAQAIVLLARGTS